MPPNTGRPARLAVAFWRVIVALATAAILLLIPWRLGTLLLRTTQATGWIHYLGLVVFVPILGIGGLRAGRRLVRLLAAVWRDRPLDP